MGTADLGRVGVESQKKGVNVARHRCGPYLLREPWMLTRGGFLNIGIITFPRHKLCRLSEDPLSQAAPLRDIREMAGDPAILTGWLRSDRMMRLLFFND